MQYETWDIELDVVYQLNSQVTDFLVTPPTNAEVGLCEGPSACDADLNGDGVPDPTFTAPLPGALPITKGWGDQLAIRLGGDWNALPGVLAIRAGTHFETSGINSIYQTQDVLPGMRLGLHLGATLRIERFDLSFAYAHIFQFNETVTMGNNRLVGATGMEGMCSDSAAYDPNNPVVSRGCYPQGFGSIVNNGTYTAEINVFSASMRYHFE
jgi:long-subunit fatty acid transport protein